MATRANVSRRDWHPQWRRWQRRATGGTGLDPFLFNQTLNALTNVDNILDFSVVDDTILLSHLVFTALGSVGTLPAGEFFTGATAGDAGDRIIYNSSTGALLYDADGTGAAALCSSHT